MENSLVHTIIPGSASSSSSPALLKRLEKKRRKNHQKKRMKLQKAEGKKMNRPAFPNGSTPHGNRAKSRDQNLQSFGGFRMPQGNLDSTTPYPSDGPASRLYPPFNVPPHQRFRGAPRSSTAIAGDLRNNSSVDYCGDPFRNPAHQRVYPGYQDITSAESSSDHGGGINQQHHSQQRTQHPKGLRGKAAADYWRSYGKARKAEKIAGGEYVPKRKREDSNHPIQLPALYISAADLLGIQNVVTSYYGSRAETERDVLQVRQSADQIKKFDTTCDSPFSLDVAAPVLIDGKEEMSAEFEETVELIASFVKTLAGYYDPCSAADNKEKLSLDYLDELLQKRHNPAYEDMMKFRKNLPAFKAKEVLVQTIRENQVCVVSGETGCGKTTQLPQFILDDWIERGVGAQCKIVCTQPRRISAISVSERIARERAEKLGHSVGYQIRLEQCLPRSQGSILMCTTGILLRWLHSNSELNGVSHVIVDEIHEQDILSDFLLIILKDLREKRPDLRIILMSATINAEKFSAYFGGCPLLKIPGFTFPVKEYYLEDILGFSRFPPQEIKKPQEQRIGDADWGKFLQHVKHQHPRHVFDTLRKYDENFIDPQIICALVKHIHFSSPKEEAILVFVPGWEEIRKVNDFLERGLRSSDVIIIPLHSMMPTINQRQVFERPFGRRKIVVATSIAETSITIDDVVHVIDTGKIKMKDFDVERNLSTLSAQWVSASNAKQRRGRAGRVKSGICYRLYTSYQFSKLKPYPLPEIQRTSLEELCLQLKLLGLGKVAPFVEKAMEPPSPQAVAQAIDLLTLIGALDDEEELTSLGRLLTHMPVPPQLGKMMYLGCIYGCIYPILNIAAVLSYRDPFNTPLGLEKEARDVRNTFGAVSKSDHLLHHEAMKCYADTVRNGENVSNFCWESYLSPSTCQEILKMKTQFVHNLHTSGFLRSPDPLDTFGNRNSANEEVVRAVICAGLYPNVGNLIKPKHRQMTPSVLLGNGEKAHVHPKSIYGRDCVDQGMVVFFEKVKTSKVFLHDLTLLKSPFPAVLFCKKLEKTIKMGITVAVVDGWLEYRCVNEGTFELLVEIRTALQDIFTGFYKSSLRDGSITTENKAVLAATEKLFQPPPVEELFDAGFSKILLGGTEGR